MRGDDFMSGCPRSQMECLDNVMNKHSESKQTVTEASSDLGKSLVMLKRKIVRQDDGIAYIPDKRHCERVVGALNLQHAKTLV